MINIQDLKLESKAVANEYNYKKYFEDSFVDISVEVPFPPVALSIGQHDYKNKVYDNPTFTYGEMSLIKAKKKSKKTFFKAALTASYIGGNSNNYFPNIKTRRKEDLFVFDFDT